MTCRALHPWYGNLGTCELEAGHSGLHRAELNIPAAGGWFGVSFWDETSVFHGQPVLDPTPLFYAGPAHTVVTR